MHALRQAVFHWYIFVSGLSAHLTPTLRSLDQQIGIPLITALFLGLIGAAAPCQLSQSVGMLAILGRKSEGRPRWRAALAYLTGKSLVYTGFGLLAVVIGAGLARNSIPVFVTVRKVLGPLMVVVGLTMVGVLRFSWTPGYSLTLRVRTAARQRADEAPFLLGVAFGFAFCPTLFTLFFGFLIPLTVARPDGLLYPALFALGTAVPLLGVLGLVSLYGGSLRGYARQIGRGQRLFALAAGALLVVVGLHDTVVYWLL